VMRGEGSSKNFFCNFKNSFRSISVLTSESPKSGRPSPFAPPHLKWIRTILFSGTEKTVPIMGAVPTEGPWGADPIKSGHFGPYTTSPGHAAPIQMKPFFFNSTGPPAGFIGWTPLTVACVQVTPRGPWGGEPIKSGHLEPFTSPGWAPAGPGHRFAAGARPALTTKRAGETA